MTTRILRVRCINLACEDPAETTVTLPTIAPGVVQGPADLRCATCGFHLWTEPR